MNLNQVTLPVDNIEKATAFYLKLGFTQIVDTPHYARFECPGNKATFSLSLTEEHFVNGAVIYFESAELDHWLEKIKQTGIEIAQAPQEQRYLWREAVVYDPSGNKIILFTAGENRRFPPWRVTITQ